MIRRPPRSTPLYSSAASDVYKRQPSGNVTVCAGDSLQLTASGASSYLWTTSATTPSIWVHQSGVYDVIGSFAMCSSVAQTPASVTVDTPTVPTVTQSGNVISSVLPEAGYQWILNGNMLSGDTAQSYTISQTGSYALETRDIHGCYARSIDYTFTYVDGIILSLIHI